MALVLADRVKETSTTTGTGTYTLAGAVSGFESFGSIGNGNTTYYACTLGADFEVGIGTYTSSGTTLARTTILQSSNSDNAVSWGSGTKTLFCTQPAEKAVFRDASGHIIALDGRNLTNVDATTLDSIDSGSFLRSDAADSFSGKIDATGTIEFAGGTTFDPSGGGSGTDTATDVGIALKSGTRLVGTNSGYIRTLLDFTSGSAFQIGQPNTSLIAHTKIYGGNSGVELYENSSKKFETSSTGATVTGELVATSLDISGDVDVDGTLEADAITLGGVAVPSISSTSTLTNKTLTTPVINGFSGTGNGSITGDLTLTSTDAGSGKDPTLDLYRNSSSPASSDAFGHIDFSGNNDAGEKTVYASIEAINTGVADGSEEGRVDFKISDGGATNTVIMLGYDRVQFSEAIFLNNGRTIVFEGANADAHETSISATEPTQDNTLTLPNISGTFITTGNSDTPTTTTSSGDADFVLVDDGGTMKKITPSNLGITSGGTTAAFATAMAMVL